MPHLTRPHNHNIIKPDAVDDCGDRDFLRLRYGGDKAFRHGAGDPEPSSGASTKHSGIKVTTDLEAWKEFYNNAGNDPICGQIEISLRQPAGSKHSSITLNYYRRKVSAEIRPFGDDTDSNTGDEVVKISKAANESLPSNVKGVRISRANYSVWIQSDTFERGEIEQPLRNCISAIEGVLGAIQELHSDMVFPSEIKLITPSSPDGKGAINASKGFGSPYDVNIDVKENLVAPGVGGFAELVLNPDVEERMTALAANIKNPEILEAYGAKPVTGLLLYGPAGTGKTSLVHALASESGWPLYVIRASDIFKSLLGHSEQAIAQFFERLPAKCILFLDEAEQLTEGGTQVHEVSRKIIAELKTRLGSPQARTDILVVAASNSPEILDANLFRSGRFSEKIKVGLPDLDSRKKMFKLHLDRLRSRAVNPELYPDALFTDERLTYFADSSNEFSGADISDAVDAAVQKVAGQAQKSGQLHAITEQVIFDAIRLQDIERQVCGEVGLRKPVDGFGDGR